jgi:hypothetical protein
MNDGAMIRGLVAAMLTRLDEATLPLRDLLSAANSGEGLAGYFMCLHHQQSLQEMRTQNYKTNDILEIGDDVLEVLKKSGISINGTSLDLEVRELLLLLVLARQARSPLRDRAHIRGTEARFTRVATLIEEIDRAKAEANLGELWRNAIDTDVHKAVSSLRKKLAGAGFNRNLIEGKRGSGYRLSTPNWNLVEPGANDH